MAPGRGAGSLAQPVSTGRAGEWKQAQSRRGGAASSAAAEVRAYGRLGHAGFHPARGPELATP
eukprot:3109905-Alexandrium_andersonii.AAC.1